jgi:hypothetical protein
LQGGCKDHIGWQTFSLKEQKVSILGSPNQTVPVLCIQVCSAENECMWLCSDQTLFSKTDSKVGFGQSITVYRTSFFFLLIVFS